MAPLDPLVSVIIPCHNYGRFLSEAIDSVLQQKIDSIEIIVVNDGSTDDTHDVAERYQHSGVQEVRRTHPAGVSAARNAGLELARGKYVAFLDADDRWKPKKLETCLSLFDHKPELAGVFTDFVRFSEAEGYFGMTQFAFVPELSQLARSSIPGVANGWFWTHDAFCCLLACSELPAWPSTWVLRGEVARSERFDERLRIGEDLQYLLKIGLKAPLGYIDAPLSELRRHESNVTLQYRAHCTPGLNIPSLKTLRAVPLLPRQQRALNKRLVREWRNVGSSGLHSRNITDFLKGYMCALFSKINHGVADILRR